MNIPPLIANPPELEETGCPILPDHSRLWQVLEQEYLRLHMDELSEPKPDQPRDDSYARFVMLRNWLNARRTTELQRLTLAVARKVSGEHSSDAVEALDNLPRLEQTEQFERTRLEGLAAAMLSENERASYETGKTFDQDQFENQARRHRPEGAAKRLRAQIEQSYDGLILRALYAEIHRLPPGERSALCLSGGGIRSATFGLGVLQGLARYRYLEKFTYLSTVSGGGYIGGWLSAWLRNTARTGKKSNAEAREIVFSKLGWAPGNAGQDLRDLEARRAAHSTKNGADAERLMSKVDEAHQPPRPDPLEPESQPVEHLRRFSNYLTPHLGGFSADTWTIVATVLRNLLLTWLVIIPAIMVLLLVPRIMAAIITADAGQAAWLQVGVAGLGLIAATMALRHLIRAPHTPVPAGRGQAEFKNGALWPLCLASTFLISSWSWAIQFPESFPFALGDGPMPWWQRGGLCGLCIGFFALVTSGRPPASDSPLGEKVGIFRQIGRGLLILVVCAAAGSAVGWSGGRVAEVARDQAEANATKRHPKADFAHLWQATPMSFADWLAQSSEPGESDRIAEQFASALEKARQPNIREIFRARLVRGTVCLGPSVFFLVLSIAFSILVGLRSHTMPDSWREWYARANGWSFIAGTSWGLISAIVLWGPDGIAWLFEHYKTSTGLVGVLSGLFTVLGGKATASPANKNEKEKGGLPARAMQIGLKLAAPIFSVLLLIGLVEITTLILQKMAPMQIYAAFGRSAHENSLHKTPWWALATVLAAGASVSWLMGRYVNVNKFSLNAMYRNRLIRAYLGASRRQEDRAPDPFTGFDGEDNFSMHELRGQRPFHVLNIALNLVGGDELAWQDRQAESFVVTPLVCGSRQLGYRRSTAYALGEDNIPMTLGTAISISGAAASPNHGYNSSAPVAFLMTLFNARLGAWLGNPGVAGEATYKDDGPRFAMRHLAKEALGLTNDAEPYVYLSDGGHFENLGLYEMVLRRCSFIVVSDAGCDPDFHFEDLGNAIAKVRIDLGIPITFEGEIPIYPRKAKKRPSDDKMRRYAVVGEIHYAAVDGEINGAPVPSGILIYLKPALCNQEPIDVFHYAQENETFPHETTADQWFSEAQFESYRALGFHIVDHLCRRKLNTEDQEADARLSDLRTRVEAHMKNFSDDEPPAAKPEPVRPTPQLRKPEKIQPLRLTRKKSR